MGILAIFVSSITGTAGNAGTQSLAVAVRRLASRDEDQPSVYRQFFIELFDGSCYGISYRFDDLFDRWFLEAKLYFRLCYRDGNDRARSRRQTLAGSFIPNLMDRIGVDPAVVSGPFISTLVT